MISLLVHQACRSVPSNPLRVYSVSCSGISVTSQADVHCFSLAANSDLTSLN